MINVSIAFLSSATIAARRTYGRVGNASTRFRGGGVCQNTFNPGPLQKPNRHDWGEAKTVNVRNAPVGGSEMLYGCGRMNRLFAAVMVYIMQCHTL